MFCKNDKQDIRKFFYRGKILNVSPNRGCFLGTLMVFGWILFDLVSFITSKEPHLALRLLNGSAVAVMLGALLGLLCIRYIRFYWTVFFLSVLACILSLFYTPDVHPSFTVLPRVILFLLLGGFILFSLVSRWKCSPGKTAITVGVWFSSLWWMIQGGISLNGLVFASASLLIIATQFGLLRKTHNVVFFAALVGCTLFAGIGGYLQLQIPRADIPVTGTSKAKEHPNLLLIVLDTVRAQSLSPYGYNRITTPLIDDFVRRNAIIYRQARATSSWTLPSHASIFTGRLPIEHNAIHPRSGINTSTILDFWHPAQRLGTELPTLAELLAQRGYQTAAVVGNFAYLSHKFGIDRGFEHYDDRPPASIPECTSLAQIMNFSLEAGLLGYRDAETITETSIAWLKNKKPDEPFFLFINYLDAHWPYIPPKAFRSAFQKKQPRNPLNPFKGIMNLQYDRSLSYLDQQVGRLLNWIEEQRLLDKTVIIITSDHGEAFEEHGFGGHGKTLYDEEIKVPLYVSHVNKKQKGIIDTPVTGTDVFFLALQELGFEQDFGKKNNNIVAELFRSSSKIKRLQDKGHKIDRDLLTWIESSHKFIVSTNNSVEVYNLRTDPGEKKNLAAPGPEQESISTLAKQWWSDHPPSAKKQDSPVDKELIEGLKALGYLD